MVQEEQAPKNTPTVEIVPIALGTKLDVNFRIQKTLKEKEISPHAYQKYLKRMYGNTSFSSF